MYTYYLYTIYMCLEKLDLEEDLFDFICEIHSNLYRILKRLSTNFFQCKIYYSYNYIL